MYFLAFVAAFVLGGWYMSLYSSLFFVFLSFVYSLYTLGFDPFFCQYISQLTYQKNKNKNVENPKYLCF